VERATPPLKDRIDTGSYEGALAADQPSILVSSQANGWQRVKRGARIHTADTLVALPGYTAVISTRKGAKLLIRGSVRDFALHPIQTLIAESAVVLHKNDQFDLDLTVLRGRVYIRNNKESKAELKVRLRFQKEVWDLTLDEPGTEVGFDVFSFYQPDLDYRSEEPRANAVLCLFRGELGVRVNAYDTYTLETESPKVKYMQWDSSTGKVVPPLGLDRVSFIWDKTPPAPETVPASRRTEIRDMITALKNLELLAREKAIDVALRESLEKQEIAARKLAVYCLGAIDDVGKVIEVLGDENPDHWIDRDAATHTLQRWVSRSSGQNKRLFDPKTGSGLLIGLKFKKSEAETIVELLFDVNPTLTETYEVLSRCLAHRRVAIAELGYYHLRGQLQQGRTKLPSGFNAALPLEDRERYAKQIDDMIAKKQLPPPPPATSGEASKPEKK
jgi:hypothetical protein